MFIYLGKYYIESCSKLDICDDPLDKLWLVIKSQQDSSIKRITDNPNNDQVVILKRGDVIKLGRAILKVRDLKFGDKYISNECLGPYQDNRRESQITKVIPE